MEKRQCDAMYLIMLEMKINFSAEMLDVFEHSSSINKLNATCHFAYTKLCKPLLLLLCMPFIRKPIIRIYVNDFGVLNYNCDVDIISIS